MLRSHWRRKEVLPTYVYTAGMIGLIDDRKGETDEENGERRDGKIA